LLNRLDAYAERLSADAGVPVSRAAAAAKLLNVGLAGAAAIEELDAVAEALAGRVADLAELSRPSVGQKIEIEELAKLRDKVKKAAKKLRG
jgi:hypothetical protein